jgi:hypothetical protein
MAQDAEQPAYEPAIPDAVQGPSEHAAASIMAVSPEASCQMDAGLETRETVTGAPAFHDFSMISFTGLRKRSSEHCAMKRMVPGVDSSVTACKLTSTSSKRFLDQIGTIGQGARRISYDSDKV